MALHTKVDDGPTDSSSRSIRSSPAKSESVPSTAFLTGP